MTRTHLALASTIAILAAAIAFALKPPPTLPEIDLTRFSAFQLDQQNGTIDDIPHWIREMDGKRVTFTTQMWNLHQDDHGYVSCFQAVDPVLWHTDKQPPTAQQFWDCQPLNGINLDYRDNMIRVTGFFRIRIRKEGRFLASVFHIDVEQVQPSNPDIKMKTFSEFAE